jgi:hypothetical protein
MDEDTHSKRAGPLRALGFDSPSFRSTFARPTRPGTGADLHTGCGLADRPRRRCTGAAAKSWLVRLLEGLLPLKEDGASSNLARATASLRDGSRTARRSRKRQAPDPATWGCVVGNWPVLHSVSCGFDSRLLHSRVD